MNKTTEALKLAEEALAGGLWDYGPGQDEHKKCEEVLAIIREALAEQEKQEPVAKGRILELAKQERVLIPGLIGFQDSLVEFARVIAEEVLQTAAPVSVPKQEPVAWNIDADWLKSVLHYADKNPDDFPEIDYESGKYGLDAGDVDALITALNTTPPSVEAAIEATKGKAIRIVVGWTTCGPINEWNRTLEKIKQEIAAIPEGI